MKAPGLHFFPYHQRFADRWSLTKKRGLLQEQQSPSFSLFTFPNGHRIHQGPVGQEALDPELVFLFFQH